MKRFSLALLIVLSAFAKADFVPENEFFIGVDSRQTIPTGLYAGKANQNYNRLTFLYAHQYDDAPETSHYHAKSVFTYTGSAASPVVTNTTSNYLPEASGTYIRLLPGSGSFTGKMVTGYGNDHFENMTLRPASWLNRPGAKPWEVATYNSGGSTPVGRWTTPLGAANLALEVVSLSAGLSILDQSGSTVATGAGQQFSLGSGDFAATPVFSIAPTTTGTLFTAQLRLVDLTGTFGNSGVFEYRFQAVPEPTTMVALGLGAVAALRRRRKAA